MMWTYRRIENVRQQAAQRAADCGADPERESIGSSGGRSIVHDRDSRSSSRAEYEMGPAIRHPFGVSTALYRSPQQNKTDCVRSLTPCCQCCPIGLLQTV